MYWSQVYLHTFRDEPKDAEIISHKLILKAGLVKKVAPGIYTYGFLALRSLRKIEKIIREELNNIHYQEILMPMVHPKQLWEESNRWDEMGDNLLRFENRNKQKFCLGATHEEVVLDYVRHSVKSYRNLPVFIYQIQNKFRDEIRPRFGLMRGREFIMKDAYSFNLSKEEALKSYERMYACYEMIFSRLGLSFCIVEADAGNMGGSKTHEFQVLSLNGEDKILKSDSSSYAANLEVVPSTLEDTPLDKSQYKKMQKIHTPGQRTIKHLSRFLKIQEEDLVKILFVKYRNRKGGSGEDTQIGILLRGSDELNFIKLKKELNLNEEPLFLTNKEIQEVTGALPGSCGPVGLNIPLYLDKAVENKCNYVVGANEDDYHWENVNHGRDFKVEKTGDFRFAKEGDPSPDGKGKLVLMKGIEVGHVFFLGDKYSKSMKATYLNKEGKPAYLEMGCYGIGVSRTLQAAIEQNHDKNGIIWSQSLTPFDIHLCVLDSDDAEIMKKVKELYVALVEMNWEVFVDDRDERPGVKFKDADLLGFPLRINLGKRGLSENKVDMVERKSGKKHQVSFAEVLKSVQKIFSTL